MEALLDIQNFSLSISNSGERTGILEDISFSLQRGEVIGLVGPSGSGKSMLIKSILGLHHQIRHLNQKGNILFQSQDLIEMDSRRVSEIRNSKIATIWQQSASVLNPSQKIGSQLLEKRLLGKKVSKADAQDEIMTWLEKVELTPSERYYHNYPHQLSGGQIQRVLIALALINDPEIILADEPFSALDRPLQEEIVGLLGKIKKELGVAMLVVSHDMGLIKDLCDRVIFIKEGKIIGGQNADALKKKTWIRGKDGREPKETRHPIIEIKCLTKTYKKHNHIFKSNQEYIEVFSKFDFNLQLGEIVGLMGASGSGKSTLARIITGIESYENGSLKYLGKEINELNKMDFNQYRKSCQLIFQDPSSALTPHRSIRAALIEICKLSNQPVSEKFLERALAKVGLEENLLSRLPSQLSGGQKQRVMIARALLSGAKVLVCDEITSSLDDEVQNRILDLLIQLNSEQQVSIIFISHRESIVNQFCDRVVSLNPVQA